MTGDAAESTVGDYQIRGESGGRCQYERCTREASVLVQYDETEPTVRVWDCPPHAGNEVQKHDDAHTVTEAADAE